MLGRTLGFEVIERKKLGRPEVTRRKQVEEEIKKIIRERKIPLIESNGVALLQIREGHEANLATTVDGENTGF